MQADIYNNKGEKKSTVPLPERVFGAPWNSDLVHQVIVSMQSNQRGPIAHTKIRSEVRGGGRKPWRQKGTGNARHGSRRSPIWRGGGITFGPRNDRNFKKKINKKMKAKALFTILSQKLKDNEILFVDHITFAEPKTKDAKEMLQTLSKVKGFEKLVTKRNNATLVALGGKDEAAEKSFNNLGNVAVGDVRNMDPISVLRYKYLIVSEPEKAIKFLEGKLSAKESKSFGARAAPKKKTIAKKHVSSNKQKGTSTTVKSKMAAKNK